MVDSEGRRACTFKLHWQWHGGVTHSGSGQNISSTPEG